MKIGILGGGQLGRMLALAGYPLGLRFRFMDPSPVAPAGHLAELVGGSYEDTEALDLFADGVDLITYEFENVPVASARHLQKSKPVYPPPAALEASQDRVVEKTFFNKLGISTAPFEAVDTLEQLQQAAAKLGFPCILKTRRMGYDGKGQFMLRAPGDLQSAFEKVKGQALILEGFVPFEREVSMIAARSTSGQIECYPLVENTHREGILRLSVVPAPGITAAMQAAAEGMVKKVLTELNYAGVLAIEFFVKGGTLIANEMAPRVHNSGHWTIEGAETSQFENHLRGILGWNLGPTHVLGHAAMVNFIGAYPSPAEAFGHHGSHAHWYGKHPAPNRKVGHLTIREDTAEALRAAIDKVKNLPGVML